MTDEQWVWLFANQNLDADEKLENMCPECQKEVTQEKHCIRCGKRIDENANDGEETVINESFDMERYEAMKNGTYKELDVDEEQISQANFDMELLRQMAVDMNKG